MSQQTQQNKYNYAHYQYNSGAQHTVCGPESRPPGIFYLARCLPDFVKFNVQLHCNITIRFAGCQQSKNKRTTFDNNFCRSHFVTIFYQVIADDIHTGLFASLHSSTVLLDWAAGGIWASAAAAYTTLGHRGGVTG